MERLLFAFFDVNPDMEMLADQIAQERLGRLREEHERCSPLAALFPEEDS